MPYKAQTECYRTFDGVRWPNWCDVDDDAARRDVAEARAAGCRLKMRKHPLGFQQAFIHPDDIALITAKATA